MSVYTVWTENGNVVVEGRGDPLVLPKEQAALVLLGHAELLAAAEAALHCLVVERRCPLTAAVLETAIKKAKGETP